MLQFFSGSRLYSRVSIPRELASVLYKGKPGHGVRMLSPVCLVEVGHKRVRMLEGLWAYGVLGVMVLGVGC